LTEESLSGSSIASRGQVQTRAPEFSKETANLRSVSDGESRTLVIGFPMPLHPPRDEAENDRYDQQYRAGSSHPFHEQGQTLSEQIAEQRYDERPQNCPSHVVEKKNPPR